MTHLFKVDVHNVYEPLLLQKDHLRYHKQALQRCLLVNKTKTHYFKGKSAFSLIPYSLIEVHNPIWTHLTLQQRGSRVRGPLTKPSNTEAGEPCCEVQWSNALMFLQKEHKLGLWNTCPFSLSFNLLVLHLPFLPLPLSGFTGQPRGRRAFQLSPSLLQPRAKNTRQRDDTQEQSRRRGELPLRGFTPLWWENAGQLPLAFSHLQIKWKTRKWATEAGKAQTRCQSVFFTYDLAYLIFIQKSLPWKWVTQPLVINT